MKKTILALALGTMASLSMAGSMGDMYVSGSMGQSNINQLSAVSFGATSVDTLGKVGKVGLGMQLTPNYAVEVSYFDLGKYDINTAGTISTLRLDSYNISLVGEFQPTVNPKFSLGGTVGLASTTASGAMSKSGYTTMTYGVSASYELMPKLDASLNWDRFQNPGDIGYKIDAVTVGLKYKF